MEKNLEFLFSNVQIELQKVENNLIGINSTVVMNALTYHLLNDQIKLLKKSFHGLFSELNKSKTERG